uniref:Growth hormone secretagogue receptor type 1 n=1 Tax=Astatotilapia calliptera TaxID=8154 RepID=A0A3P8PCA7_ASTCA
MRCQNKRRAPHKKLRRAFAYIRFSGGGQSLFRTLKDVEEAPLMCVTVIYIPLMLFGLLGNILTILVVWLRPHMRTSTYLYLSSMAVSDLLILLLLPLDLYKLWRPRPWPLGDLACKLTMFLSECCTFCTILHITFLSLERYLAVCWPITAKTVVTRRRTRAIIGCLWLSAAGWAKTFAYCSPCSTCCDWSGLDLERWRF